MSLWQDLRFAVRLLVKDRWFTARRRIALALGIGVNTTVFTFVNAVLIRGLPFDNPDRIIVVGTRDARDRDRGVVVPGFRGLARRRRARSPAWPPSAADDERQRRRPRAGAISGPVHLGECLQTDWPAPLLGRDFLPEDDRPGARGGGDPRQRHLEEPLRQRSGGHRPHDQGQRACRHVIGVMPEGFKFPNNADLWLPLVHLPRLAEQKRDAAQPRGRSAGSRQA